jgi:addiction module HigA family antidote
MTSIAPTPYQPDVAIPPGETIREILESKSMTQAELANRMGRPTNKVNEVIQGKRQITADTALELELALGLPASFWINLEKNYQLNKARLSQDKRLEREARKLSLFPVREMCKRKWIEKRDTQSEQAHELLSYFGITTFAKLKQVKNLAPAWRKTRTKTACEYALAAWLQQGIRHSHDTEVSPFDASGLRLRIPEIRSLTEFEQIDDFEAELKGICAEHGVAVVFVRHLPKSYVSGAAYRVYDRTVIQLSNRYKWADSFWFNFFHELGHVLLHLSKRNAQFVDEGFTDESDVEEVEADDFAKSTLIPDEDLDELLSRQYSRASVVKRFADELGIHPGIVVGRLHQEKIHRKDLAPLRIQYTLPAESE